MTAIPAIACSKAYHDALKRSPLAWQRMEYVGRQPTYDPERPGVQLELRNCSCGSTLAVEIEPEAETP